MTNEVKQLNDDQLESFDVEYVDAPRWQIIEKHIERDYPDGDFTFIDIGGGNGKFADLILDAYPKSKGAVLDNSELLLSKNTSRDRKKCILSSAEDLLEAVTEKYDIVFYNWVLHHLVHDSYADTVNAAKESLACAGQLLTERGKVSIFENMYDGILVDNLPSHLIFHLTSSKLLEPVTRFFGANTAGVGVCFQSRNSWDSIVNKASLDVVAYQDDHYRWEFSLYKRAILHLGDVRAGHFWCSRAA